MTNDKSPMTPFLKMHGAGNDFVVFDARKKPVRLSKAQVEQLSDRRFGIGCDQLVVIEPSDKAVAMMRIFNADGSAASACGNATRCVGSLLMEESGLKKLKLETPAGVLEIEAAANGLVTVDMGAPKFEWHQIPLVSDYDTLNVPLKKDTLSNPVAVNMGNPHAVFFVSSAKEVELSYVGPQIENHPMFPDRINVSVAQVVSPDAIVLRVWERGAGETLACGTAACATLVAAHRRGLTKNAATITLTGGVLNVEWRTGSDGHVWMTGPVAKTFEGRIAL